MFDDSRRLEPGHQQDGVGPVRNDEHRQPLERHRLVAREVGKVGPDRQLHLVDPEVRHSRAGTGEPRCVHEAAQLLASAVAMPGSADSTARLA